MNVEGLTWFPLIFWATVQFMPPFLKRTTCPTCPDLGAPAKYTTVLFLSPTDTAYPARYGNRCIETMQTYSALATRSKYTFTLYDE